jgi:hypothetical protein
MWNLESWGNSYNPKEYAASYEFYKKKPMGVTSQPHLTGTNCSINDTANCSNLELASKKCKHFTDCNAVGVCQDNSNKCKKHYQTAKGVSLACQWNQNDYTCNRCQTCTFDN